MILNLHWLTAVTMSRGSKNCAKSSCDETLKVCFQRPDISGLLDAATQRISCAFRQGCALSHSICDQASLGHKWSQIRAMATVIMSSLLFYPQKRSWSDASHDSEACITFKDFKNWFLLLFFLNAFGREGRLALLTGWNEREKRGQSCLRKRCLRCRDCFTLPVSVSYGVEWELGKALLRKYDCVLAQ